MTPIRVTAVRLNATALITIFAAGCALWSRSPEPVRFKNQEDAGTVEVAVQSVAPFEEYISALEPNFTLNTEQALQTAVPQTADVATQAIRETMAILGISNPAPAAAASSGASGTASGTAAAPPTAAATAPAKVDVDFEKLALPGATVDLDPTLRFHGAAALLQEIALLNHYVRDAAVQTGTKPYIVRLLATVHPAARGEAYDVHTTVSFFTSKKQSVAWLSTSLYNNFSQKSADPDDASAWNDMLRGASDPLTRKRLEVEWNEGRALRNMEKLIARGTCTGETIAVIPLLVTEDMESALRSNSSAVLRDLALTLQATLNNTGTTGGARRHTEDLNKSLGRNLNSVYTLGQAAPNAVQARFGAVFAGDRLQTVARTYSISLLLLVKTGSAYLSANSRETTRTIAAEMLPCPAISFTAHSRFSDSATGEFLRDNNGIAIGKLFDTLAATTRLPRKVPDEEIGELYAAAAAGDYETFKAAYGRLLPDDPRVQDAYTRAIGIANAAGASSGEFVLSLNEPFLPSTDDRFSLFDDGTAMKLTIANARNILKDRLQAVVKIQVPPPQRWLFLTNNAVEVPPDGRSATFTFPSGSALAGEVTMPVYAEVTYGKGLRAWQTEASTAMWYVTESSPDETELECCERLKSTLGEANAKYVCSARAERVIQRDELPISYFKAPAPPPATADFTITLPSSRILAAADGTGELVLEIRSKDAQKPQSVRFSTSGAFIDNVTPTVPIIGADRVASDGIYLLKLKNLSVGTPVQVHAFRLSGKQHLAVPDETATVQALPDSKKDDAKKKE